MTQEQKPNVPLGYADLLQQRNDLLAALESMYDLINDAEWTQHQRKACILAARTAIAKAKGESK